ncbi:Glycosyl transferase family 2 [Tissierella praeacuta DSM 18095]|uniref:Glycosyl transferase family 2 n=1 Tax=Tissierella praeacuta DSM 18095 TaxID=1123404 RepID=A0A1M4SDY5_9FIRM|nr:glycosyltransferase family 2 protein [Tissierella praeacuta]TCU72766.1 glycosyl transferase family 2 [Tissierella praeacuta]SHE30401.1 Glycosyl transferase family 2 [Tissierella praeacuta DSM 18095]SUP01328.1 Bactoprenol glucosyl transferase homolog from prophage CPS-53 [Tissierella praeacuta]
MQKRGKLICVVPVYNEADLIIDTVENLKKIKAIDEIVIVNDGSKDNTLEVANTLNVSVIDLGNNYGKGYAMKRAIDTLEYDYIAFVDGDLGESSIQVEKLILPIINGEADVSIAKFPKRSTMTHTKGGIGAVKALAKKGVYFFTKKEIDTSLSGQRVYKKEVIDKIDYIPDRYGIEVAMTIQTINNGFSIIEVPVTMNHRYSQRNLEGFIHRGKQFKDILKTFIIMYFRR